MHHFTANQITVFPSKITSLQIEMIRGDEWFTITNGLSMMNALSSSKNLFNPSHRKV
jgi:hypothetical protein